MAGVLNVLICYIAVMLQGPQSIPVSLASVPLAHNGAQSTAAQDKMLSEQIRHTQRVARLLVIQQIAMQDEYAEITSAVDKLLEEEYKRHNDVMEQWTQSRLGADANDINDVWWKDVGKKRRDGNSSSLLLSGGW